MPRCLMAKKWKAYSWPQQRAEAESCRLDEIFSSDGDHHHQQSRDSPAAAAAALHIDIKRLYNENNHYHPYRGAATNKEQPPPSASQQQQPKPVVSYQEQQDGNNKGEAPQQQQQQQQHHLEDNSGKQPHIQEFQIVTMQTDDEEIDVVGDVDTISGYSSSTTNASSNANTNTTTTAAVAAAVASTATTSSNSNTNGSTTTTTPNSSSATTAEQQSIGSPTCWGPHSPTAGTTAPSPPPLNASGALYYHGFTHEIWNNHEEPPKYATLRSAAELAHPMLPPTTSPQHSQQYQIPEHLGDQQQQQQQQQQLQYQQQQQQQQDNIDNSLLQQPIQSNNQPAIVSSSSIILPHRKSLSMCFTSTGTALSLPPKKKDIYRPYSLQQNEIRTSAEEDLSAAQAILDLSASPAAPNHSIFIHTLTSPSKPVASQASFPQEKSQPPVIHPQQQQQQQSQKSISIPVSVLVSVSSNQSQQQQLHQQQQQQQHEEQELQRKQLDPSSEPQSPATAETSNDTNTPSDSKTVAYTYEAFFVSDGRSKRRSTTAAIPEHEPAITQSEKPKFTCTECGKQYATSSNLSRHKQTHRSLDSQSAKKCIHCGKAYVSMPALAMHVLTHKLAHSCGVCGKMFSRPWLLQGHLRSHTGEKPYGCAHCGKAFADRSNLRAHMQTHSADKNYECSRCHKTFALKSYLNKHLESACLRDDDSPPNSVQGAPGGATTCQAQQHLQLNRGL